MKYQVVETKVGYIVQNTQTYTVAAGPYSSKEQALATVNKLNTRK